MPVKPVEAVNWMMEKLIKAVGEAKMLSVRLHGVKHQQSLCYLMCMGTGKRTLLSYNLINPEPLNPEPL